MIVETVQTKANTTFIELSQPLNYFCIDCLAGDEYYTGPEFLHHIYRVYFGEGGGDHGPGDAFAPLPLEICCFGCASS